MSSAYWRTAKQIEPFNPGKCATDRVIEYEKLWKHRCYSNGIPDEVSRKVAASNRAPSWKAVAIAILQNDLNFYQLGFSRPAYEKQKEIVALAQIAIHGSPCEPRQLSLFPNFQTNNANGKPA